MGREIRRVPPGWEHPRTKDGHYIPKHNKTYRAVADDWMKEAIAWNDGTHPRLTEKPELKDEYPYYWDYSDLPPNPDSYLADKNETECTHYQVYETVSEGTPKSPVLATLPELVDWLVAQGHSRQAAEAFAKRGWAPSMVIAAGRLATDIHTYDLDTK